MPDDTALPVGAQDLDRTIHEPARLVLLTALAGCESADFVYLRRLTGMTAGNLSSHLGTLTAAGLVVVDRSLAGRTTRTDVALTEEGHRRLDEHWRLLDTLRRAGGQVR